MFLKPFALLGIALGAYYTSLGSTIGLSGFSSSQTIQLFELLVEIVLFALVLHEDEDITITQVLFLGASSLLLLQSDTLMSFILSFESLSLISVILVSYIKTKDQAQGAVKMFMASGIATGILFLGVSFYVMGGGNLLAPLKSEVNTFELIGSFLMLVGIFYKLTIVPFHGWAIDTYEKVRHSHAAILSGVAKTVVALATFKIFSPFLSFHIEFAIPFLVVLSLVTMTLGNFLALYTKNLAQMLSYSSIAHAGYILLAFLALKSEYADEGILYISIAYIFMQSAAFLVLDILRKTYKVQTHEELGGFFQQNRLLAFLFTIQLFSLAGIPLLAGFLGKAIVFYAVVDAGLWWVALVALLNSALSVGYYAWVVKAIYFDEFKAKEVMYAQTKTKLFAQIILAVGTLFFGVFATYVFM
jgi:NADH-quinone oxidoreductase subunit N